MLKTLIIAIIYYLKLQNYIMVVFLNCFDLNTYLNNNNYMYVLQHCCITAMRVNEITNKSFWKNPNIMVIQIKEWNYCKEFGTIKKIKNNNNNFEVNCDLNLFCEIHPAQLKGVAKGKVYAQVNNISIWEKVNMRDPIDKVHTSLK